MANSTPILLPSPKHRARAHSSRNSNPESGTSHINHIQPTTYAFMSAEMLSSSSPFDIDLTMDRQTRRKIRRSAGRSGGVFQLTEDAKNPWDLEYITQYPFQDNAYLPREAQPFSFFDESSDEELENKDEALFSSPPDNSSATYNHEPHQANNDSFVEHRAQSSSPCGSNTTPEDDSLLSALPSRLNVRKTSGQSTSSDDLELPSSVTLRKQTRAILQSELASNLSTTSRQQTTQLRSNMDELASYLEKKLAAVRGMRSKGKPVPAFLRIHPENSYIATLQGRNRAQGIYNDKRAGVSQFSLDDQTALQKITGTGNGAVTDEKPETTHRTEHNDYSPLDLTTPRPSKFTETEVSAPAEHFEQQPAFTASRSSRASALQHPKPVPIAQSQLNVETLAFKPTRDPAWIPPRKPLPESVKNLPPIVDTEGLSEEQGELTSPSSSPKLRRRQTSPARSAPAQSRQRPPIRRAITRSYLDRKTLPPPPPKVQFSAAEKALPPPRVHFTPNPTDLPPPAPAPAPASASASLPTIPETTGPGIKTNSKPLPTQRPPDDTPAILRPGPKPKPPTSPSPHPTPKDPTPPQAEAEKLTPAQRYENLKQQVEDLSSITDQPVTKLWNRILKNSPDNEERYSLTAEHASRTVEASQISDKDEIKGVSSDKDNSRDADRQINYVAVAKGDSVRKVTYQVPKNTFMVEHLCEECGAEDEEEKRKRLKRESTLRALEGRGRYAERGGEKS